MLASPTSAPHITDPRIAAFEREIVAKPTDENSYITYIEYLLTIEAYTDANRVAHTFTHMCPTSPAAHGLHAITCARLGKSEEMITSFEQAIGYDDSPLSRLNYAYELHEIGQKTVAQEMYEEVLANHADNHQVLSLYGRYLIACKRYKEAEEAYRKALELAPNTPHYLRTLNKLYWEFLDNKEYAAQGYLILTQLTPDDVNAWRMLANLYLEYRMVDQLEGLITRAQAENCSPLIITLLQAIMARYIYLYDVTRYAEIPALLAAGELPIRTQHDARSLQGDQVLRNFVDKLYTVRKTLASQNLVLTPQKETATNTLFFVGDSHSMPAAFLHVTFMGKIWQTAVKMIVGAKIYNLGKDTYDPRKENLARTFKALPKGAHVIFSAGEIDCRLDGGGFLGYFAKNPEVDEEDFIHQAVKRYAARLNTEAQTRNITLYIANIPAPWYAREQGVHSAEEFETLTRLISTVNQSLEDVFGREKIIDFYNFTNAENGGADGACHLDWTHLSPSTYLKVLKTHK